MLFSQIDGAAAFGRAALTLDAFHLFIEAIIDGQLFAGLDIAQAHIDDVAFDDTGDEVRVARMIDVLGAGAAYRSIEGPIVIEREEIDHLTGVGAPFGFAPTDSFAGIFDDLTADWYELRRVDAPAVDFRFRQLDLETGVIRIDLRNTIRRAVMTGRYC